MPGDAPARVSRRGFLVLGAGALLVGCGETTKSARALPGPAWDAHDTRFDAPERTATAAPDLALDPSLAIAGVLPRTRWAAGRPAPALMNRMLPLRYITVHHDGMTPFTGASTHAAAGRLEAIRRAHRGRGWGDIGYHFAVDRSGQVWQCRPMNWQGAHVKDWNEGNIGIVALGNFDEQEPTSAQVAGLTQHIRVLRSKFRIAAANVKTHQEWAATACPGRSLQSRVNSARSARLV